MSRERREWFCDAAVAFWGVFACAVAMLWACLLVSISVEILTR